MQVLVANLSRELGTLGTMRAELSKLDRAAEAAHGRSRLADLVSLVRRMPVVTSGMASKQLRVSRVTALSLITGLEGQGALVNVTARKAARFWTIPSIAARLKMHKPVRQPDRQSDHRPAETSKADLGAAQETGITQSRIRDQFDEDRLDEILAILDQVMAETDSVLEGISQKKM